MHELGVVFYVIRDVKRTAVENNVHKVNSVTLEIGEVSGVIHDYLIDCWEWAKKKEPILCEAELRIEELKAVTYCEDCGGEYETVKYAKICPYCKSEHTYLLRGNEFMIKEIEVIDEELDEEEMNATDMVDSAGRESGAEGLEASGSDRKTDVSDRVEEAGGMLIGDR